jgi:hypothetical protein
VNPAVAGGAIAATVNQTAMGFDLHLQDGGIVAAGKEGESLPAALTTALRLG